MENVGQGDQESESDQSELKDVGIGDGPEAAHHGVQGDYGSGEEDRDGKADTENHVEAGADGDEQLSAPEDLGKHRGNEEDGCPALAETRFEGVDQRVKAESAHTAGEKEAADDETHPETETSLNAGGYVRFVGSFSGAEEVTAIHPGGGHGEEGDPLGQAASGDDEVGGRAVPDLARRDHADSKENGEDEEENGQGQRGFYLKAELDGAGECRRGRDECPRRYRGCESMKLQCGPGSG